MKRRLSPFFILLYTLSALICYSFNTPKQSLFHGVWQFKEGTVNNGERGFPHNVQLKIYGKGKFEAYTMTPQNSVKTMNGNFKILNDSVYIETVTYASNKAMIRKKYMVSYMLRGDVMLVSGFYDVLSDGVPMKVNYHQTWKKVNYPSLSLRNAD